MKSRHGGNAVNLVVVGSIGLDTIETPVATRRNILGGSVSYACAAASFFARTGMVGVVGRDFPARHRAAFRKRQSAFCVHLPRRGANSSEIRQKKF